MESPEVGQYYLVACAITKDGCLHPIIPIPHKDPEFAPHAPLHYHHDGRFSGRRPDGSTCRLWETNTYVESKNVDRIEYRRRKFKGFQFGLEEPSRYAKYKHWAKKQIGKPCANGVCPHRKAKMVLVDGVLVCPMHNLVGDPATNKIIGFADFVAEAENFLTT